MSVSDNLTRLSYPWCEVPAAVVTATFLLRTAAKRLECTGYRKFRQVFVNSLNSIRQRQAWLEYFSHPVNM